MSYSAPQLKDAFDGCVALIDDEHKFQQGAVIAFADLRRACLNADPGALQDLSALATPMFKFLMQFANQHYAFRMRRIVEVLAFLLKDPAWEAKFQGDVELEADMAKLPGEAQETLISELKFSKGFLPSYDAAGKCTGMYYQMEDLTQSFPRGTDRDACAIAILNGDVDITKYKDDESGDMVFPEVSSGFLPVYGHEAAWTKMYSQMEVPTKAVLQGMDDDTYARAFFKGDVQMTYNRNDEDGKDAEAVAAAPTPKPISQREASTSEVHATWQWIRKDGLPGIEGEDFPSRTQDGFDDMSLTVEEIRKKCEVVEDCVGFSYCPATGCWYPKKKKTGFYPNVGLCTQKNRGEVWEWHYISERAPDKVVFSTEQTYMWMWGDHSYLATFNPRSWSEWKSAAGIIEELSHEEQKTRPVKIKNKNIGDWWFDSVDLAVAALKASMENGGEL